MVNGFIVSTADSSLFIFRRPNVTTYLLVYVVDKIFLSFSSKAIDRLVDGLRKDFQVKDLGPLHYFMGIEVHRLAKELYLC